MHTVFDDESSDEEFAAVIREDGKCAYSSANGSCRISAQAGVPFCVRHTCETPSCTQAKASKDKHCPQHTSGADRDRSADGGAVDEPVLVVVLERASSDVGLGFVIRTIGLEGTFVTAVQPGSVADGNVRVGDQILSVNSIARCAFSAEIYTRGCQLDPTLCSPVCTPLTG
jgi:hypothetical protein